LMDSDKSVTATFTRQFSLSVSVQGGGAVALDPSGGVYDSLEVVTLTATPDSGWVFAGWSGDLSGSANPDSLLMDGNKSVTAIFEELAPLVVRAKIFLGGAYHGGSMNTILNDNGWLPLSQPYNRSPWNYAGAEAVDSLPAAVVDWVLVGLRISPETSDEAARAALLASDGTLLDTNGVAGVTFEGVEYGDYYIVVYHRNHLAVMSAAAQSLNGASSEYDFTIALDRAYGINPMKELGTGAYGMFCGDGNSDGVVNEADKESVWRAENATTWSYDKFGDFNLDGGIDVLDLNYCWRANAGAMSGVPGITAAKGLPGRPAPIEKSSKVIQQSSGKKN
ncbi:MAG: hypothetical protein L6Q94_22935, partial [Calditrichia bacterium]|nr:hypothetical protein [Calditrichia bacterium]